MDIGKVEIVCEMTPALLAKRKYSFGDGTGRETNQPIRGKHSQGKQNRTLVLVDSV